MFINPRKTKIVLKSPPIYEKVSSTLLKDLSMEMLKGDFLRKNLTYSLDLTLYGTIWAADFTMPPTSVLISSTGHSESSVFIS